TRWRACGLCVLREAHGHGGEATLAARGAFGAWPLHRYEIGGCLHRVCARGGLSKADAMDAERPALRAAHLSEGGIPTRAGESVASLWPRSGAAALGLEAVSSLQKVADGLQVQRWLIYKRHMSALR